MASTADAMPTAIQGPKEQYLTALEMEHATTVKVLRAYPADKQDLKPSEKGKSAIGLASIFAGEQMMSITALTTGFDWSKPMEQGPGPKTMAEAIDAFESAHKKLVEVLKSKSEAELLAGVVQFPVAPKTIGDMPMMSFLWMVLCDQIHHRGQFSVYLRIAGGKLPSIYGPTADEPWM